MSEKSNDAQHLATEVILSNVDVGFQANDRATIIKFCEVFRALWGDDTREWPTVLSLDDLDGMIQTCFEVWVHELVSVVCSKYSHMKGRSLMVAVLRDKLFFRERMKILILTSKVEELLAPFFERRNDRERGDKTLEFGG